MSFIFQDSLLRDQFSLLTVDEMTILYDEFVVILKSRQQIIIP